MSIDGRTSQDHAGDQADEQADEQAPRDLLTPEFMHDPYPTYGRLREECPVARCGQLGGFWMVTQYNDVREVARAPELFSSGNGTILPPLGNPMPFLPMESDPPEHTRYRRAMQPWFSVREMQKLEPGIREVVTGIIDSFEPDGRADLSVIADQLPLIAIALLLGLPSEDWPMFAEQAIKMVEHAEREDRDGAMAVAMELMVYLAGQIEQDRRSPRGGLMTRMIGIEVDGEPIPEADLMSLTFFMLMAGHETTVGSIGVMLAQLAQDPALKQRLIRQPELIDRAIEESLRLSSPIQALARTVEQDVAVGNVPLRRGDRVMLAWASANRDASVFPDPDDFVVDRSPNNHLAFGDGIHRCLGANLGRLEMRVVLEEILRRIPDFRLEDGTELDVVGFTLGRKVKSVPVVW